MNQSCFVLDFGHSSDGCSKRMEVTYRSLLYVVATFAVLIVGIVALGSTYLHMSWKISRYERLAADFERLRNRYQELQKVSRQHSQQMASLETLASEVSVAYGLNEPAEVHPVAPIVAADTSGPSIKESIAEYNFLKAASIGGIYRRYGYQWHSHSTPNLWPIAGVIRSSFGGRSDPFSGEGTFHTGIDFAAPIGTPVRAAADGVVTTASWVGGYGKLLVVDHGNGIQTYYAHLSRVSVIPGEEVRAGEVVAHSGSTGRSTGPHMHYEVRLAGTPVNPYKFLPKADRPTPVTQARLQMASSVSTHNDLGL